MAAQRRDIVEFDVSGPIILNLPKEKIHSSGCSIIDLQMKSPSDVGELVFRNYYTAYISVLVCSDSVIKSQENTTIIDPRIPVENHSKSDSCIPSKSQALSAEAKPSQDLTSKSSPSIPGRKNSHGWMLSIPRFSLMKDPHQETGSQDIISITANKSLVEWKNLTLIRLILQQPSPVWHTYYVEEINLYRDQPKKPESSMIFQNTLAYSDEYEKYVSYLTVVRSVTDTALSYEKNSEDNESKKKSEHGLCTYEFSNLSPT